MGGSALTRPAPHRGPHGLPGSALTWAAALAPSRVVRVDAVAGGITATKWVLHLAVGDPVVLRWSDPRVWGAVGREHVRREALGCRLLAGTGLPAPRLLGSDPAGVHAGGPANLLSWRPGHVRLDRLGPAAIDAWAGLAAAVHRQAVPPERRPPPASSRVPPAPLVPPVPGWTRRPALWRRAVDVWAAGAPATPAGLLHRDFHLGNTLWQGDAVSGLVDWAETSWGPADLDVAHACCDVAMLHTAADAELFRAAYRRHGGRLDPDPDAARFWVVSDILGFLPDPAHILAGMADRRPDLTPEAVRRGLEDLLALTLG
ncbi:Phosphotransferase enzyme family protein [Friedmanniella luteola]|uniref:Phosphotransferase enzyme family protein n=1 Tax=Friedmanniella luteola TaxID=546871 RepID=A0A1H1XJM4_9ACTN|nr:aminoglycoside phosphotransferase family protein [Friedmanniella luteola]SDT09437.1 Phosphotransferase enzyme family protein [Friedmanniella luteola]